ncbi:MAG: dihydrofolate reductase [Rhodanobacteraceae bacterium]|nr:dihydrofolate reductase [Rhodanobacteraceae bacterium]
MTPPRPIAIIAALDRTGAIGLDNDLPWRLPDDLKRFKALTTGHAVLMGRKTAESLGRALPNRRNLVLTRSGRVPFDGMQAVASPDEALSLLDADDTLMVIGGAEIYELTLPSATLAPDPRQHLRRRRGYLLPLFDESQWQATHREAHPADERHEFAFEFVDYERLAGDDTAPR